MRTQRPSTKPEQEAPSVPPSVPPGVAEVSHDQEAQAMVEHAGLDYDEFMRFLRVMARARSAKKQ